MIQALKLGSSGTFTYLADFQVTNTHREKHLTSEGPREAFYRRAEGAFGDFIVSMKGS